MLDPGTGEAVFGDRVRGGHLSAGPDTARAGYRRGLRAVEDGVAEDEPGGVGSDGGGEAGGFGVRRTS